MTLTVIDKAGRWDTRIQQGSTFVRTLDFGDSVTIDGWDFRGQIRATHDAATVLAQYAVLRPSPGIVVLRLEAAETAAIPVCQAVHDIEAYQTGDTFVARILEGRVLITPEVTR